MLFNVKMITLADNVSFDKIKSIIIFYSYEGNTRFIAKILSDEMHSDMLELQPVKEMNSKGFMKYVWGGKKVLLKQKPKLKAYHFNPNKYDFIIFGTPVWAFNFAPALRTFFSQETLTNKKIALYCCHEGGMKKTLDNMMKALPENKIISMNDFNHPLINNKEENTRKAVHWAHELIKLY